jgi:glutamine cyclotransferase
VVRSRWVIPFVLAGGVWPGVAGAATPTVHPTVLAEYPHDANAFTQGLLLHGGALYESTGLRGRSSLRRVEPTTGSVLLEIELGTSEFGEGLARVDDRLIQLTWQEHVAHVYDLETFEPITDYTYDTEGWGLCFDGHQLVMSDGSDQLFFRDPGSFALLGSVSVVDDGVPLEALNELECVRGLVLANVWMTDSIAVIDPKTGQVLERVDASGLLSADEQTSADVLNGIAYDAGTGHFYLTGKLWPKLFEVELELPLTAPPRKSGSCAVCAVGERRDAVLFGAVWFVVLASIVRRRLNPAGARSRAR